MFMIIHRVSPIPPSPFHGYRVVTIFKNKNTYPICFNSLGYVYPINLQYLLPFTPLFIRFADPDPADQF